MEKMKNEAHSQVHILEDAHKGILPVSCSKKESHNWIKILKNVYWDFMWHRY